ncbi:hypothetical protein [Brunnivagina elsteri]|uniref:Uncharacterized protein n=1 Tax=Brunnivagina elsteri CCALA 953 TaxID=987040 RepID=A0A2A2TF33_9CYAN|nr:hypothetical protein [Calothrix elsteri]PAX52245.1 hypothetical protein CK510_20370 [Calothrix elsteri CCALA 953]
MGKKKDFAWRYQPPINSDKAKMLSFIQNQRLHPFQDKTMMIMTALNAYYMPLALYNEGSCSREDLELIFLDGVNAIANHIRCVCIAIKIDPTAVGQILCSTFGLSEISHSQPEKQLISDTQLPLPNTYEELDNYDPQIWNLAGMTTDSESFD